MKHPHSGFTLVEAMITVAILAILAAIAMPNFWEFIKSRRVDGFANTLLTDIRYARSEAARRNDAVSMYFSTDCYVIYLSSATTANCTGVTPAAAEIKTITVPLSTGITVNTTASTTQFDAERGVVTGTPTITVSNGSNSLSIQIGMTGSPKICKPSGSTMGAYQACGA